MPGPHDPSDQAAGGYQRSYDQRRRPDLHEGQPDRPARGSLADLRQRLERLPCGHPSSPYHDDGTRKPGVVRLKDLELPVPSDVETTEAEGPETERPDVGRPDADRPDADRPDADRADADRAEPGPPETGKEAPGPPEAISPAASDQPRSGRDGSWEWKGSRLSADQCRIADQTLSRCRAAEGRTVFGTYGDAGLTPSMRRIETQLENGQLVPDTEKFALKSPDRFKEKLASLIARFPGAEPRELAAGIHDSVRYTFLFAASDYTHGVAETCRQLTEHGYEHVESRPSWGKDEYKGVNSRWRDLATGLSFEIQWHTPESWDAKQKTHEAYEKIGDPTTPVAEVERLRAYQRQISGAVAVPPGALQIPPYKKES